jgi:hypothetical protein
MFRIWIDVSVPSMDVVYAIDVMGLIISLVVFDADDVVLDELSGSDTGVSRFETACLTQSSKIAWCPNVLLSER